MGNLCAPKHEAFNPVLSFPDELDDDQLDEIKTGFKKEPTMKMTLTFSCKNLVLKGEFDPMVVLYRCDDKDFTVKDANKEEFKTEAVADEKNPQFVKRHTFDFEFETTTYFQVRVYHEAVRDQPIDKQKIYGQANFTLQKLINAEGRKLEKIIYDSDKANKKEVGGKLIIMGEEKKPGEPNSTVSFQPIAKLQHQITEGDIDPKKDKVFLIVSAQGPEGNYLPILKTECQGRPSTQGKYTFNRIRTNSRKLANHDESQFVVFSAFKFRDQGRAQFLATWSVKYQSIKEDRASNIPTQGVDTVTLDLQGCSVHPKISFLDYIFGGTEIALQISVDLTLSNGRSHTPDSLHYISEEMTQHEPTEEQPEHPDWKKNLYYQALGMVASNLENYDSDKLIPMYGFGCILPSGEDTKIPMTILEDGSEQKPVKWTSNCFAMNGDASNPQVEGVEEVLRTYRETTPLVEMWGPTLFNGFLKIINDQLDTIQREERQNNMKYTILLILTDGTIAEKTRTQEQIIRASKLPVSIIIIGIGKPADNFEFMRKLDADKEPLRLRQKNNDYIRQTRDCVQFLACHELDNDPEKITRELLREIPDQITAYFDERKLVPGERDSNALEKFKKSGPDTYFPSVSKKLVDEAVKLGANKQEVQKLLNKEKNPDFRPEWMVLNAPKVNDEPGMQLNKIAAKYVKNE